jgi:antitoxin component YwqK of YwqJK toxin-antitoxin module
MNPRTIIIASIFFISAAANCQTDTKINITDQRGLKQGNWIKKYPNGNVMYEGFFADDHPVGEFKRYYEDKTLKSLLIYSSDGKEAMAEIFHPNGYIASKGKYINQLKEGKWQFFSEIFNGYLISEEQYSRNIRNGISLTFYPDNKVAEKVNYVNDLKQGEWIKYYPDGKICFKTSYLGGKVNGKFEAWYENGAIQFSGQYKNDLRNGTWLIFNNIGSLKYKMEYLDGVTNDRLSDFDASHFLDSLELNKGKIADPEKSGIIRE